MKLRVVADLPLTNRCDEDFTAMEPAEGGRRCAACERVVHDLSAMSAREAARFVAGRRGERTCYRYLARPDGALVFAPEPARPLAPLVIAATLAACTPHAPPQLELAVQAQELPSSAPPVVIPAALPEPDEPCEPAAEPDPAKPKRPKKPPAKQQKEHVQYLGFEG